MFSSLPSASKIYLSSNKPKQKGVPSAKRKRKKVSCSSSADSHSEDTLVSRTAVREPGVSSARESSQVSSTSLLSPDAGSATPEKLPIRDDLVESPTIDVSGAVSVIGDLKTERDSQSSDSEQNCHDGDDENGSVHSSSSLSQKDIVPDVLLPEAQQSIKQLELNEQNLNPDNHSSESGSYSNDNPVIAVVSDDDVQSHPLPSNVSDDFTQTETNNELNDVEKLAKIQPAIYKAGSSLLGGNLISETGDCSSVRSDCCMSTEIYQDHVITSEHSSLDDTENDRNDDMSPKQSETSNTESMCNVQHVSEAAVICDKSSCIKKQAHCDEIICNHSSYHVKRNFHINSHSIADLRESLSEELLQHSVSLPESFPLNTTYKIAQKGINHCIHCDDANFSNSSIMVHKETSTFDLNLNLSDESTSTSEINLQEVVISPVKYENFDVEARNRSSTFQDATRIIMNTLPSVSTIQARSRSYVFGSIGAPGSLLGNEELKRFFPDSRVRIFVGTWNMNGQNPPKNIDDFLLPLDVSSVPDIYAVGVQESMQSRSEWEILLQTTLGPTHVLFASSSFGVLHLSIFMRRDLIWFCSEPEEANIATRPGSMIKTKGAVAICFLFFGTSFLFVNSHLTAHEQNLKERLSDIEKICSSLELPKVLPLKYHQGSKDVTSRFDSVFWCGDLNFRLVQDRPSVMSFVEEKIKLPDLSQNLLMEHDQLSQAMAKGIAFHEFKEGVINFIPSYKFSIGTSCFDSYKQRVPSYTDRILYRCKHESSIVCLHYDAVPEISTSDHKPVFGIFDVSVQPGRDNIPLAAGLFKRNVYLEAIKRRAQQLEMTRNHKQSTVCNVM